MQHHHYHHRDQVVKIITTCRYAEMETQIPYFKQTYAQNPNTLQTYVASSRIQNQSCLALNRIRDWLTSLKVSTLPVDMILFHCLLTSLPPETAMREA